MPAFYFLNMAFKIPDKLTKMQSYFQKMDFEDMIDLELEKLEKKIVQLNQSQIRRGERSDGSDIKPDYEDITVVLKEKAGTQTPGEPFAVNLYDTGAFYAGFQVLITNNQVIIDSSDSKSDDLQDKYGEKIFGLQKENLNKVLREVRTSVVTKIKNEINGL